ncbi:MAG: hypothetical protein NXI24_25125 [bacterium]|nr:hypothetical protein [bacterium]
MASRAIPGKSWLWALAYAGGLGFWAMLLATGPVSGILLSVLIYMAIVFPVAFVFFWLMERLEIFSMPWFFVAIGGLVILAYFLG